MSVGGLVGLGSAGVFLTASPIIIIALISGSIMIFTVLGAIIGLRPGWLPSGAGLRRHQAVCEDCDQIAGAKWVWFAVLVSCLVIGTIGGYVMLGFSNGSKSGPGG